MTSSGIGPTTPAERIEVVDILRGFALFGILWMNMPSGPVATSFERGCGAIANGLAEDKFITQFSFLFGLGFTLQFLRAEARGVRHVPVYLRRLLVLFLLALAHVFFLRPNDILVDYAVMGLLLLPCRKLSPRLILALAALCFVAGVCWNRADSLVREMRRPDPVAGREALLERVNSSIANTAMNEASQRARARGTYPELVSSRVRTFLAGRAGWQKWFKPIVFCMFLLGLWAGQRGIFDDVSAHHRLLRRVMWTGLAIGIPANVAAHASPYLNLFSLFATPWPVEPFVWRCAAVFLCLFYLSGLTLLVQQERWRRRLAPLGYAGRMALTNFFLQSLICSTVFDGYGFALKKCTPLGAFLLSLFIFSLQILFSKWWLSRRRFGPMEWIWRSLTYLKLQPMRAVALLLVAAVSLRAQPAMEWMNPLPTGSPLYAVAAVDAATVYAAGEAGTLLKSADGGKTWTHLASGTTKNIRALLFTSAGTGFAAGDDGLLLRSAGQGAAWAVQPSGSSAHLRGLAFAGTEQGVAVGDRGTILRTSDAGATWMAASSGTRRTLRAAAWAGVGTIIAVGEGGIILRSADSGKTWKPFSTGEDLYAVAFANAHTGVAVGGSSGFFFDRQAILHTHDGGTTWQHRSTDSKSRLYAVAFADADTGFAAGEFGKIYSTTDAGATWRPQQSKTTDALVALAMVDSKTAIAVGEAGVILRTSNRGATWLNASKRFAKPPLAESFIDEKTGTLVGANGSIRRTSDGGATWEEQKSGVKEGLYDVFFLDLNHGAAVGAKGTIVQTSDAGKTWIRRPSAASQNLLSVCFVTVTSGTAVGLAGTIVHTEDGGSTWQRQVSGVTNILKSIRFTFPEHGVIVGGGGTILVTDDRGAHWRLAPVATTEYLEALAFADARIGVAVGTHGTILRTLDGGTSWRAVASPTQHHLLGVSFSGLRGIAAGCYGVILRTADGGATWKLEQAPTLAPLLHVSPAGSIAIVRGMQGALLRSAY